MLINKIRYDFSYLILFYLIFHKLYDILSINNKGVINMIRERVQNYGAIPRHYLIKNYDAFVLINRNDVNQISLYKKDFTGVDDNQAYYIRFTNNNCFNIEVFQPTHTFDIFDDNYDAFIADNIIIDFDIAYDRKPYTDNFYNG